MFEGSSLQQKLEAVVDGNPRYGRGAYDFMRQAVTYASEVYFASGTHVTGSELLEATRRFARNRYGLLTRDVFESWGVRSTEDFGVIVFHLIEAGVLSKTEDDSLEDFRGVYEFAEVFDPAEYWQEVLATVG
jgi:uncharacterized repeat protein (TIGR04138 family)